MKMKEMDKDLPKIDLKDLDITDDSEPVDSGTVLCCIFGVFLFLEPLNLNEKCQRLEDENNYLKAQVASSYVYILYTIFFFIFLGICYSVLVRAWLSVSLSQFLEKKIQLWMHCAGNWYVLNPHGKLDCNIFENLVQK